MGSVVPFDSATLAVADGMTPIAVIMLVLGILFVSGRLFSNISTTGILRPDDFACIGATILFFAFTGVVIGIDYQARHSLGPADWLADFDAKAVYAAETIAGPATFFAKSSVLLLYLRLFTPRTSLRYLIYIGLAILFCAQCLEIPVWTYYCASHDGIWDHSVTARCEGTASFGAILATLDAALNVYILILPIPSIMALHLSLKKRLGVVFILLHGVFALAASFVGLYYRVELLQDPSSLHTRTAIFVCILVELAMTIVSGCFHACFGYVKNVKAKHQSTQGSSTTNSSRSRDTATKSGTFVSQVRLTREMSAEMISTRSEIVVYDDDILSRDDLPRSIV